MNTDNKYKFEDVELASSVNDLKAIFYDVVEKEQFMLKDLESRITTEEDDNLKNNLLDLWTRENESSAKSVVLFKQLTNSIKVVDSYNAELRDLYENVAYTDESIYENNEEVVNNDLDVQEDITNIELDNNEVPMDNVEQDVLLNDGNLDVSNIDNDLSNELIDPNENTQAFEPITDENIGELIQPTIELEDNNIELSSLGEDEQEVVQEQEVIPVYDVPLELQVSKMDDLPVKAIVVNDNQYTKLVDSFDAQKTLFMDKGLLPMIEVTNNNDTSNELVSLGEETNDVSDVTGLPLITPDEEVVNNIVNDNASSSDLEKMMETANSLYNAGKTDEAQAMYDEISSLNQAQQSQTAMVA